MVRRSSQLGVEERKNHGRVKAKEGMYCTCKARVSQRVPKSMKKRNTCMETQRGLAVQSACRHNHTRSERAHQTDRQTGPIAVVTGHSASDHR